jgi:hypothetical protein
LEKQIEAGIDRISFDELDRMLMRHMDDLCYSKKLGKSKGNTVFYGMLAACPELGGMFPRTVRALRAWSTIAPGGEGGPMPEEIVWVAVKRFLQLGLVWEAIITAASGDGYLRSMDWAQLSGFDVMVAPESVALSFGIAERGCESKTGTNQGVVICRGWVAEAMRALKKLVHPHSSFFPVTQSRYRSQWQKLWDREGHPEMRAVHDLRHTAAAEDLARGRRDLVGIQRRGRWKSITSCERYTKTHLIVKRRAEFGAHLIDEGLQFAKDPRAAIVQEILGGPARDTEEGRALVRAYTKGDRIPDTGENMRPAAFSPRIEPLGDPSEMPDAVISKRAQRKGRVTRGFRAGKVKFLEEGVWQAEPPEFTLDSADESVCAEASDIEKESSQGKRGERREGKGEKRGADPGPPDRRRRAVRDHLKKVRLNAR